MLGQPALLVRQEQQAQLQPELQPQAHYLFAG